MHRGRKGWYAHFRCALGVVGHPLAFEQSPRFKSHRKHNFTTMRLLDTNTLQLVTFLGDEIPLYAILSQRAYRPVPGDILGQRMETDWHKGESEQGSFRINSDPPICAFGRIISSDGQFCTTIFVGIEERNHQTRGYSLLPDGLVRRQHAHTVRRGRRKGLYQAPGTNHQGIRRPHNFCLGMANMGLIQGPKRRSPHIPPLSLQSMPGRGAVGLVERAEYPQLRNLNKQQGHPPEAQLYTRQELERCPHSCPPLSARRQLGHVDWDTLENHVAETGMLHARRVSPTFCAILGRLPRVCISSERHLCSAWAPEIQGTASHCQGCRTRQRKADSDAARKGARYRDTRRHSVAGGQQGPAIARLLSFWSPSVPTSRR